MELRVLEGDAERDEFAESGEQLPEYLGWLRLGDVALLLYSVEEVTTPDERGGAVLAANVYLELKENNKDAFLLSGGTETLQVNTGFNSSSQCRNRSSERLKNQVAKEVLENVPPETNDKVGF